MRHVFRATVFHDSARIVQIGIFSFLFFFYSFILLFFFFFINSFILFLFPLSQISNNKTKIDEFYLEIEPSGLLLFIRNKDIPGMAAFISHVLGEKDINISFLSLGRHKVFSFFLSLLSFLFLLSLFLSSFFSSLFSLPPFSLFKKYE